MITLVNSYEESQSEAFRSLVESSAEGLPYTLAHPLKQLYSTIGQANYAKAKDYLLELFELSAQYLSVVLLSLLREHVSGQDSVDAKELSRLASVARKIDTKRPLSFGDWCNDILPPLTESLLKLIPQSPLAVSLSRRTTSKHNLFVGGKNEISIVYLRNHYKGHGTMLTDEKYHELLVGAEPRLMQLLEALSPLWGCTNLHQDSHFWVEGSLGVSKIDLFPLVFADSRDYVYLFQSLNDEKAYYVSANEQAEALLTADNNPSIDAFFQVFEPSFDVAKRRNWTEWTSVLSAASNRFLQGVYREKKYNRELFVDRGGLSTLLGDFLGSDDTFFPLPGEAGQGKTNQLCFWCEQLLADKQYLSDGSKDVRPASVLLFSGSDVSGTNLDAFLHDILNVSSRKSLSKVLEEMHQAAEEAHSQLLIMVDALNECENYKLVAEDGMGGNKSEAAAVALFKDMIAVFAGQSFPCFKILFTCRNYTWKQLLQPEISLFVKSNPQCAVSLFTPDENGNAVVRGFTDDELRDAYAIYSDVYSIHTPFSQVARSLALRLKDPLVLKIACTNYLGATLPETTGSLTSLALWDGLYANIRNAYAGSKQIEILNAVSDAILKNYLDGKSSNSVNIPELRVAFDDENHPMHRLSRLVYVRKNGDTSKFSISVAFAELVNRPERPVLRYTQDDRIQFVYERFLEYMLSRLLLRRFGAAVDDVTVASFMKEVNSDEVMLGAMRNVLIKLYADSGDSGLLVSLIARHSEDFLMMTLLTDVMNVLVRENYEEELFSIEEALSEQTGIDDFDEKVIGEFNSLSKKIDTNQATSEIISRFNQLHAHLKPMLNLRTMAIQTLLGGIFLTDWFNEDLYHKDPFSLLWTLTDDPLVEVKDAVCLQSYYVSYQHYTLGGTPIDRNLSEYIASRMYDWLDSHSVVTMIASGRKRRRMVTFLETATRLLVMQIIDVMLSEDSSQQYRIPLMLDRLRSTVRHLTLNHTLVRLVLPALNIVMRRQLTFQKDYVNNAIEYQRFWTALPQQTSANGEWSKSDLPEIMRYIFQYSRYYSQGKSEEAPDFKSAIDRIWAAYQTGDSLSYFVIERLIVINGVCSWESIRPLMQRLDDGSLSKTQWWDYTQMSIIYDLYQLGMKMPQMPDELMEMFGRWCVDWTRRLRGLFVAPNSAIANPRQKYKRNVMTWYAMVYAYRNGDVRREPYQSVPLFYQLLDEAVDNRDGELLVHLVENISELVADSGYVQTALDLLSHLMHRIDNESMLVDMSLQETLPSQLALLLSTAKSYAPDAVNAFIANEMIHLPFPGVEKYRDEILNYTPCGEKLSDVLTHRFGNFIIFGLIHQEEIDRFCYDVSQQLDKTKDFTQWFAIVVRMLLRDLLKINIKVS